MSITHVNTQFGTPTASLSSTSVVTKPTGLAVGDVMVAVVNANQAGITSPGAHWTRLISQDSTQGNLYRCEVWYCVATSTETAASTFTFSDGDANSPMWAAIAAYRGVDQNNPINASNVNTAGTTNPQTGPSITTTASCLVLNIRTVRKSSGTTSFSSSVTNERFDNHNSGTGNVSYDGALYDSGSAQAAGTISGASVTASSGTNQTDTISITIGLKQADSSAAAGSGSATAAGNNAQALTGQSATAGLATVTAAGKNASALAGKVVFAGAAACTAATPDVGRTVRPTKAAVTAGAIVPLLFFGTPSVRQVTPLSDTHPVNGLDGNLLGQRVIIVDPSE